MTSSETKQFFKQAPEYTFNYLETLVEIGQSNVEHILVIKDPCEALFPKRSLTTTKIQVKQSNLNECWYDAKAKNFQYKTEPIKGYYLGNDNLCPPPIDFCSYSPYSCFTMSKYFRDKQKNRIAQKDTYAPCIHPRIGIRTRKSLTHLLRGASGVMR